ncbi:Fic family protein [Candidatus Woesearchaeota archaeon]|nr:Fic family protein [Candidatus Woesearchaeota archaeon]
MVTKYDIFEIVYKNNEFIKPIEVVERLKKNKSEYKNIYRILNDLEKNKFLVKSEGGFQVYVSDKTRSLYELIDYCVHNNINYNLLLDENLVIFINEVLKKKEFQQKDMKIDPKTFKKYIEILNRFGLLLIISKKPFKAMMFYNTLINNILVYFGYKYSPLRKFDINYLDEIEKELILFRRSRKKNEMGYKKIVNEFETSFIQHSLSLEGNPITLPDTIKILRDEVIPRDLKSEDVDEIKNYQKAILKMLKDASQKRPLTKEAILEYHKLAMQHKPDLAGKIRKKLVHIKGNPDFKIASVSEIEPRLNNLLERYNDFVKKKKTPLKEIIDFSAYFHNEFQHIHPFEDGNSRTTRLITFHLLHLKDIPILDIPFGLLDEYLGYTKGSREREDKNLFQTLQRIILFNLKKINERLNA